MQSNRQVGRQADVKTKARLNSVHRQRNRQTDTWVDEHCLEGLSKLLEVSIQQVFFFLVGGASLLPIATINIFSICCCWCSYGLPCSCWLVGLHCAAPRQRKGVGHLRLQWTVVTRSFTHSFVHSLIHSFIHSFIHTCVCSFIHFVFSLTQVAAKYACNYSL